MTNFLNASIALTLVAGSLFAQRGPCREIAIERGPRYAEACRDASDVSNEHARKPAAPNASTDADVDTGDKPAPQLQFERDDKAVYVVGGTPRSVAVVAFGREYLGRAIELPGGAQLLIKPEVALTLRPSSLGVPSIAIPLDVWERVRKQPLLLQPFGLSANGLTSGKVLEI